MFYCSLADNCGKTRIEDFRFLLYFLLLSFLLSSLLAVAHNLIAVLSSSLPSSFAREGGAKAGQSEQDNLNSNYMQWQQAYSHPLIRSKDPGSERGDGAKSIRERSVGCLLA